MASTAWLASASGHHMGVKPGGAEGTSSSRSLPVRGAEVDGLVKPGGAQSTSSSRSRPVRGAEVAGLVKPGGAEGTSSSRSLPVRGASSNIGKGFSDPFPFFTAPVFLLGDLKGLRILSALTMFVISPSGALPRPLFWVFEGGVARSVASGNVGVLDGTNSAALGDIFADFPACKS